MAHQYQTYGYVTNSIALASFLHMTYVVDFFINEAWYLSTCVCFGGSLSERCLSMYGLIAFAQCFLLAILLYSHLFPPTWLTDYRNH